MGGEGPCYGTRSRLQVSQDSQTRKVPSGMPCFRPFWIPDVVIGLSARDLLAQDPLRPAAATSRGRCCPGVPCCNGMRARLALADTQLIAAYSHPLLTHPGVSHKHLWCQQHTIPRVKDTSFHFKPVSSGRHMRRRSLGPRRRPLRRPMTTTVAAMRQQMKR